MSRRRRAEVRQLQPDLVYQDVLVSAMINRLMQDGKKNLASRIFYGACRLIQERTGQEPLKVFKEAFENIKPRVEVRSRRVGGSTYQVPVEFDKNPRRQQSLTLRWMVNAANSRPERTAIERLAGEIMDAAEGRGGAMKKKDDVERMAEANRAYAHYRW
ncbi:30S ribosomal protein S7 [Deinococcus sp. Marseille-Q6407]|uniref:30S ribosomal protein S7 n=1 Tax=Deinococcus sp. Marseille-Q6407 TaxID=2969223 RepID=UPI0021C00883|nr:30S ribosomal protein S7 [Deinococcus sp. Marseille-Q6407]